jgi:hypothetical protein
MTHLFDFNPGGGQQLAQRSEPVFPEMAQQLAVYLLNRFIQAIHQLEALGRDARQYHTPVAAVSGPRKQAALFHAVEEPGDVGIPCDHAAGNLSAGKPLRRPSQDAQDVVLSLRKVFSLEDPERSSGQHVGSAEQVQECRLFRAAYAPDFAGFGHVLIIFVITTIVKTYIEIFWI